MTEYTFIRDSLLESFPNADVDAAIREYETTDVQNLSPEAKCVMKATAQYRLHGVFDALRLTFDQNILDIFGSSLWSDKPSVPKTENTIIGVAQPVTKTLRIDSHTYNPLHAKVVISYVPKRDILDHSKLQSLVDWLSEKPCTQESLTFELFKSISKEAGTENVYVRVESDDRYVTTHLMGVYASGSVVV